jgi:predicted nucleic acid-binding Zn ribbon protein
MSRRPPRQHAETVASVLERVLNRCGINDGLREKRALLIWPEIVGPALAARSQAVALRDGRLYVRVTGSAWHSELHHMLPQILARLNNALQKPVKEIKLTTGPRV